MLKHYLFSTLRLFSRNRFYTLIKVIGLATGLAACLLILQYVRFERSYESLHEKADQIMRLTMDYYEGGSVTGQDVETYRPLGPAVVNEIPEAVDFVRMHYLDPKEFFFEDKAFLEKRVYLGTPSLLSIFSYKLLRGDSESVLKAPFEVLLTESTAKKYYGSQDPMGKMFKSYFGDYLLEFAVVGILADPPLNTHLKFDVVISYETGMTVQEWDPNDWGGNNDYTYVLLQDGAEQASFHTKLSALNDKLHARNLILEERVVAQPISDIHLYSHKPFEPEVNGDGQNVQFLHILAFFILLMAGVNYINMATARALERAREVGIRKTIGSQRRELIVQFLFETLTLHFIAGILALSIIQLLQPAFMEISGIPPGNVFSKDAYFWTQFIGILLGSTLLSGLYPAWVLSGYKPIFMLKGSFSHSTQGQMIRKTLVVAQFCLSLFLITAALVLRSQLLYMQNKDLGANISQTLVVHSPDKDSLRGQFSTFKDLLLRSQKVHSVSLSSAIMGSSIHDLSTTNGIRLHGSTEPNNFVFHIFSIDEHYLPQMEVSFTGGQNFLPNSQGRKIVVNEKSLEYWGISHPQEAIGTQVDFWGVTWTIVGVTQNFHQRSVKEPHIGMIMMYSNYFGSYASIKAQHTDTQSFVESTRRSWQELFPNSHFTYFFLDDFFNQQYVSDQRFTRAFSLLTGLAILIATLGLLGLASYMALKRTKEIGIRKVLGASIPQILVLLSKDFARLLGIASIITIPMSYWGISFWLDKFPFRIDLSWGVFLMPVVLIFLFSGLAISFNIIQAARLNPIQSLKYE